MSLTCPCGATTDAPLCHTCTKQLAATLRKLPGLVHDLEITATKQARLGDTPHPASGPVEDDVALHAERTIPARLRSETGRITLPATRMPVAFGAALLLRQAMAGITDWLSIIDVDPRPARPVARTAVVIRRNRAWTVRTWRGETPLEHRAAWLAGHAERFRLHDRGPEIHARALDLHAAIEATIDRADPDEFAGLCDAPGVRIDRHPATGPTCGLHCPHPSCGTIRAGHEWLAAVTGDCGGELSAPPGATEVTCPKCGAGYDVAEQRAKVADTIADRLGTVREVASYLRTLTIKIGGEERQLEVTVDKVDGWLRRKRITDHGTGPRGRLVKIGEVRAYAEQIAKLRSTTRLDTRVSGKA